jgi:acetylglutamate kinase
MNEKTMQQAHKALVLLESLPYIKNFHNEIVVIKYGGHAMSSDRLKQSIIQDIVLLKYVGMNPIIVHGGGPEINQMLALYGKEPRFVDGLRVTDDLTMEVTEMVLTGKIAQSISALFNANDVPAVAMSGKDGKTILAKQRDPVLGRVGEIVRVDTNLIMTTIRNGYVPIISPIGIDEKGESYNINADEVAGRIAASLPAYKLISITDIDGLMRNPSDPTTLIHRLDRAMAKTYIEQGIISGGMIPKIACILDALDNGVHRCHIINGTVPHSILLELFTDRGVGTMIVP